MLLAYWHWHHPVTSATQPGRFTGCQRADFPSDLGNPSRSLCQNIVFLSQWKFVGKKALSVRKILPNQSCQRHFASTGSSVSQPWPGMQENTAGWNLLPVFVMSLLQTLSLSCKFHHTPSTAVIWLCCQLPEEHSMGACSWVGQEAAWRSTGANHCNSALLASPRKAVSSTVSSFPAYMSWLSRPPFCTPKGKVLQLILQHIFLQPSSLPLQLHQPVQLSQRMHPTMPAVAARAIWGVLLVLECNIFLVLHHDGWFWLLNSEVWMKEQDLDKEKQSYC